MNVSEKKTGLFFGSFNPVHVGHMIIANYMATQTDLDEVILIVSPQNPLKPQAALLNNYDRLHLVNLAIGDNPVLRSSDIEFALPTPSYTIDTLIYLKEKYPTKDFTLIMGGDNLKYLHKWKNYEQLLEHYRIYLYNRPTFHVPESLLNHKSIQIFDTPQMHISATYIRKCIRENRSVEYLVPDAVFRYLQTTNFYKK